MSETVPDGWRLDCLGSQVGKITSGGTPKAGSPEYYGGDIPFLKIDDITSVKGRYVLTSKQTITQKALKDSSAKLFPTGTVVTTMYGTIGATAILAKPMATNQAIAAFLDLQGFTTDFLHQLLRHEAPKLASSASQTTQANISGTVLKEFDVLIPPLPEQKKIAAILSSVDDVIVKTRAQIDKLKDLKTGMMQELLTKGIGPGGAPHTEFKDSPVGRIPAGWDVRTADELADAIMVGVVIKPTQYYVHQGVPALRSANVRENGLTMENLKYFSPESNEQLHKSKLREGDLLTVRTGYPGTTAVVTKEFEGCNCIDVVITRPGEKIYSYFLCLWVNSGHGKGQVLKAQGGLAQQHFNVGDMKNLLVPVPPLEEQEAIFRAIDSVTRRLSLGEKRLAHFYSLKKALMQDLLTGKVRVNIDHKESAAA